MNLIITIIKNKHIRSTVEKNTEGFVQSYCSMKRVVLSYQLSSILNIEINIPVPILTEYKFVTNVLCKVVCQMKHARCYNSPYRYNI